MDVSETTFRRSLLAIALAAVTGAAVAEENGYVLKLDREGDVVAAVPTDGGPALLLAPLEPRADALGVQVATGVAGVLQLPAGADTRVSIGGGQQWVLNAPASTSPLWCNNVGGWLALSSLSSECLAPSNAVERQPQLSRRQAELGLDRGAFNLSLAYGTGDVGTGSPVESAVAGWTPILSIDPNAATFDRGQSNDVALSGTWRFSPISALRVSAGVGQTQIPSPLGLPTLDVDRASIGFGVTRGAFSGGLVGRVMRSVALPGQSVSPWAGLDLGVAWRTPWSGELSFGARNLLSTGDNPPLNDSPQAELELGTSRTPYVQYKQDL